MHLTPAHTSVFRRKEESVRHTVEVYSCDSAWLPLERWDTSNADLDACSGDGCGVGFCGARRVEGVDFAVSICSIEWR